MILVDLKIVNYMSIDLYQVIDDFCIKSSLK